MRNEFRRIADELDGLEIRVNRVLGAGETVIMEGRYSVKSVKATGKPLDCETVHIWDLRDGKIVRLRQYVDTHKMRDAMGATD